MHNSYSVDIKYSIKPTNIQVAALFDIVNLNKNYVKRDPGHLVTQKKTG